jgi:hypothetical protein
MATVSRRAVLAMLGTAGGLLGVGYAVRGILAASPSEPRPIGFGDAATSQMMGPGTMGGTTSMDMSTYMDMFNRHSELRRSVQDIPGGVRTTTESDSPDLVALLQGHVGTMYTHLDQGAEVTCMSASLPTLFRRAPDYQRHITFTAKGIVAVETAADPGLTEAIRAHAREVSGFVADGMPAMMKGMMGMGS